MIDQWLTGQSAVICAWKQWTPLGIGSLSGLRLLTTDDEGDTP